MSIAAKIGRKTIRLTNSVVNLIVLLVILLLLVFACYAIWDTNQVHNAADAMHYEKFKPTIEDDGASFEELRAINPEVFAWLTVYGTHIDYPVVQGLDNLKYVNTDAMGRYSLSGAIFLDKRNSQDFSDFNNILYGHHMEKQTMFGEIGLFTEETYFDAHKYGMLYYDGREHGLEFFAFLHTSAYDSSVFNAYASQPDEQQAFLDMLYLTAIHLRQSVQVTIDDRLVLLSTCSETSTNGRDVLIARITDEVFDDAFAVSPTTPIRSPIPSIDKIPDLFEQAPLWVKLIVIALPLLLILLIIIIVAESRKRKRRRARYRGD